MNTIVTNGDISIIKVVKRFRDKKIKNIILDVIIDTEDIDKIKKYNWYVTNHGYAATRYKSKHISLHKIIMDYKLISLLDIDHINRNRLDNRKVNLRKVTKSINGHNRSSYKYHKGVCYEKSINKWRVRLTINGNKLSLGCFDSQDIAIMIAKQKLEQYGITEYGA